MNRNTFGISTSDDSELLVSMGFSFFFFADGFKEKSSSLLSEVWIFLRVNLLPKILPVALALPRPRPRPPCLIPRPFPGGIAIGPLGYEIDYFVYLKIKIDHQMVKSYLNIFLLKRRNKKGLKWLTKIKYKLFFNKITKKRVFALASLLLLRFSSCFLWPLLSQQQQHLEQRRASDWLHRVTPPSFFLDR